MKTYKTIIMALLLMITFGLTACTTTTKSNTESGTFTNISDSDIPDILEITVGTVQEAYFSGGIKDAADYTSLLSVTFKDTTKADYDTLMKHYESTSTGTNENSELLYDWGRLQVTTTDDMISINAFIK